MPIQESLFIGPSFKNSRGEVNYEVGECHITKHFH